MERVTSGINETGNHLVGVTHVGGKFSLTSTQQCANLKEDL